MIIGSVANNVSDAGCLGLVKTWMTDHGDENVTSVLIAGFEAAIESMDCRIPPVDQLAAVITVVTDVVSKQASSASDKLQPKMVNEMASPIVQKWSWLIADLFAKVGDDSVAMDVIIISAQKVAADYFTVVQETLVIGVLLGLRDHVDAITDNGILSGCKKLSSYGKAMEKFIQFLEADSDDDSDDD